MSAFRHLNTTLAGWRRRRGYRAELRRLLITGDHLVKDAGLTVENAMGEVSKPAWRD